MSERARLLALSDEASSRGWRDVDAQLVTIARSGHSSPREIGFLLTSTFLATNRISRMAAAAALAGSLRSLRVSTSERALTAILFLDLVGSTDHLVKVGDKAWATMVAGFYDAAGATIEHHRGRMVKTLGDGFLCSFPDPGGSLDAALLLVKVAQGYGLDARIGVHLAEVEFTREGDMAGVGANLASRIMDKAPAGTVVVSSTLKEATEGSKRQFSVLGEFDLKGVPGSFKLWTYLGSSLGRIKRS